MKSTSYSETKKQYNIIICVYKYIEKRPSSCGPAAPPTTTRRATRQHWTPGRVEFKAFHVYNTAVGLFSTTSFSSGFICRRFRSVTSYEY